MILTKYLQKTGPGVRVVPASDGAEAVAEVKAHPLGYFSLILMDLHMPNVLPPILLSFLFSYSFVSAGAEAVTEVKVHPLGHFDGFTQA